MTCDKAKTGTLKTHVVHYLDFLQSTQILHFTQTSKFLNINHRRCRPLASQSSTEFSICWQTVTSSMNPKLRKKHTTSQNRNPDLSDAKKEKDVILKCVMWAHFGPWILDKVCSNACRMIQLHWQIYSRTFLEYDEDVTYGGIVFILPSFHCSWETLSKPLQLWRI